MDKEIGKIFRELRQEKGLSLEKASEGVISISQLSHFERGKGDLTTGKFFALIKNIDVSIDEFSAILTNDASSLLFEQAGRLEQAGKIDELVKLYENERKIYRKTNERQHQLNAIALKSMLINYGKVKSLTTIEQEILENYFYEIEEWKPSNLRFFAIALTQLDNKSIVFYLDNILEQNNLDNNAVSAGQVAKALLPTGLLILFLIITRIPELGLKGLMNNKDVWFSTALGSLGTFEVSKGLIFSLKNIFGSEVSESYKLLYVPALIPFVITVLISLPLFGVNFSRAKGIFSASLSQVKNPFIALMGALVMVNLMLVGGEHSMVKIIGRTFAEVTGSDWTMFSSFLGAVGAFFSGSNTVSNLTFGSVQLSTAETTGLSVTLILALQSVGGAMGNMVCINNIVAVSSVLNIQNKEGTIIKTTIVPMVVYGIIAALCASFLIPLFYAL